MQVTVKYRAHLATLTKIASEQITAATVKDVLRHIKAHFGAEAEKLGKTMLIAVNGESILQHAHFKTALQDGDEISFLPICGGG
ncbi:MAG: MoaD/ThiS family protein [Treponema sp.]|nr:MoaD/ThiS family protein [Treponema sp.]